jgi:hypothetical protein
MTNTTIVAVLGVLGLFLLAVLRMLFVHLPAEDQRAAQHRGAGEKDEDQLGTSPQESKSYQQVAAKFDPSRYRDIPTVDRRPGRECSCGGRNERCFRCHGSGIAY